MQTTHFSRGQKPRYSSSNGGGRPGGFRPQQGGHRRGGPKKQYINPEKFINRNATAKVTEEYQSKNTFADFGFSHHLENNLEHIGYKVPSAIQDQAIPLVMDNRDVIGLANTGTGKTAAFLLPIIEHLTANPDRMSVLIIAPTRELAQQIDAEYAKFARGLNLFSALCVGGVNIRPQIRDLQRRPHIVIGTPGRLVDLQRQRQLHLDTVTTLVLDEADRMCDMGFLPDIKQLIGSTAMKRQTLMFSATMTPNVKVIASGMMKDPEVISVVVSETNEHVLQDIVEFDDDAHRKILLTSMLQKDEFEKVIVFGETKFGVQRLSDLLSKSGVSSIAIHGNKSQSQRERALKQFKAGHAKVLVATDVAARGLDIPNVSHVINFDTPQTYDDYVHRVGRTGRAGKSGTALTFITRRR